MTVSAVQPRRRPWYRPSLTVQIMIGLGVGGVIGWLRPDWGNAVYFLRDIFINLIKSIIAPLVFSTIVVGIAGAGALRKVGRMGIKALIYFEIVTTAALVIGLAVVNFTKPGAGVTLAATSTDSQIMFKFTNYVMLFAPIGVGAAMAHTIGTQGPAVLLNLGKLIGSLYLALVIFIALIFGLVIRIARVPLKQFVRAVREPAALAFATTSSESALPKAMESMERFGVPPHIVGFVMPTGYSFNLTGSTLYLAMASVFVAQAAETTMGWHMSLGQQITMMLTLMLTSKGVAGVPRASLVILLGALNSFVPAGLGPIGVAIIFGVDELMDMGRTCVNVIGNCLATIVVARWEGEFDDRRARVFGTPVEAELDLKSGEVAFADAVAQGD
ncbi:MAG: dicarboxylate/amino acid:cation symporter [Verrucomicrobia bacterium]|nr:MAG: dicarboxylate/amino acid:cation symporter [Verrucomicrobiota bacterium]